MIYQNHKIGADPELFLLKADGTLKSAIGLIGGTKAQPRLIDSDGSAVQEDNVAVEFNIAPANSKAQFITNIGKVLNYLNDYVGQKGFSLNVIPAAIFPDSELQDPAAMRFGCEPDYNVWLKAINDKPETPEDMKNLRSCGGHIHVSWTNPQLSDKENLIKAMDIFLGATSILYDQDTLRRKLYGKAGSFRFKPYGVEYRTLSNFWIKSPDLVGWAYEQTEKAIDFLNAGGQIDDDHYKFVQDAVDNGNEAALIELQKYYPV